MPQSKTKPQATSQVVAWWLSDGDEECPHCGQLYIYELEFRCPDCDGPCCAHCKKRHATGHHTCPECANPESGRAEDSTHG